MAYAKSYYARIDSNSANNPALNLTGETATQITFVNETAAGGTGDLILDSPAGGGVDPDTQVVINGTSYSFTFELAGYLPTTAKKWRAAGFGSIRRPADLCDRNPGLPGGR